MNRFFRFFTLPWMMGIPWVIVAPLIALRGGDASLLRGFTSGRFSMMAAAWLAWIADIAYVFLVQRQQGRILADHTVKMGEAPQNQAEEWVVIEGWYKQHWVHKWRRLLLDRCLKPSILEELFYRAPLLALLPVFKERVSVFIVAFGILFGLAHASNFDVSQTFIPDGAVKNLRESRRSRIIGRSVVTISAFGIFLGYMTVGVQCLWGAIAIHFCYNLLVYLRLHIALGRIQRNLDVDLRKIGSDSAPSQDESTILLRAIMRRRRDRRRRWY